MSNKGMNRRQFLQTSGRTATGAALAGGILMASDGAWALQLSALDAHSGQTLLMMARDIYPHDKIADKYYAMVIEGLDGGAGKSDGDKALLEDGVAELQAALPNCVIESK